MILDIRDFPKPLLFNSFIIYVNSFCSLFNNNALNGSNVVSLDYRSVVGFY